MSSMDTPLQKRRAKIWVLNEKCQKCEIYSKGFRRSRVGATLELRLGLRLKLGLPLASELELRLRWNSRKRKRKKIKFRVFDGPFQTPLAQFVSCYQNDTSNITFG